MDDYISRSKLLADIEKYHVSEGYFQHWVEVQPAAEVVSKEEFDAYVKEYSELVGSAIKIIGTLRGIIRELLRKEFTRKENDEL